MRISVFGLNYVGTICSAYLADRGHNVIGVDRVEVKVDLIQSGRLPIIECDIDDFVKRTVNAGRLVAMMDAAEAIASTDISIGCVGTPSQPNGALSVTAIEAVATEIGQTIRSKTTRHEVAILCTEVPGTTREIIAPRLAEASGMMPGSGFGIAFNPEFLRVAGLRQVCIHPLSDRQRPRWSEGLQQRNLASRHQGLLVEESKEVRVGTNLP